METITKVCTKCGLPKSLEDYWNHPSGKFGKRPRCKTCVSEENAGAIRKRDTERYAKYGHMIRETVKRWARKNDNQRRKNLKDRYGISIREYDRLLEEQNHLCAICRLPMDEGKRLAVDHNHETGEIRGIVHLRCNTAIALFRDSPVICRLAAEYLEKSLG